MKQSKMQRRKFSKKVSGVFLTMLTLALVFTCTFCSKSISIFVDGGKIPLTASTGSPYITQGTTLVPMRVISEYLQYDVKWDAQNKTVLINGEDTSIKLTIGNKTAYVNGQAQTLLVAPDIRNGRTYVPFRFVGETFGYEVKWDAPAYAVIFRSKGYTGVDMKESPTKPVGNLGEIQDVLQLTPGLKNDAERFSDKDGNMYVYSGEWEDGFTIKANDGKNSSIHIHSIEWYLEDLLKVNVTTDTKDARAMFVAGVKDGKSIKGGAIQSAFIRKCEDGTSNFIIQDQWDFEGYAECDQLLFFGDDGVAVLVDNPLYEGR